MMDEMDKWVDRDTYCGYFLSITKTSMREMGQTMEKEKKEVNGQMT